MHYCTLHTCMLCVYAVMQNEDIYNLIEAHEGQPLKLYVYNTDTDSCREVIVTPNTKWNGAGEGGFACLPCSFAFSSLCSVACFH